MNQKAPKAPRAITLAAAGGVIAFGVVAVASPAAAQVPEPTGVHVTVESPIYIGDEPKHFDAYVEFGPDYDPDEHDVTATFDFDAPDNTFVFGLEGWDDDCDANDTHTQLACDGFEINSVGSFTFLYRAADDAATGTYGYTATFAVDGETVATEEGSIEILPGADDPSDNTPYLHSDVGFTGVEPGGSVEVRPQFRQEHDIEADAAAVVVAFGGPEYVAAANDGVSVVADYDNCLDEHPTLPVGVTCVITDFYDLPRHDFTITDPVVYQVSPDAPGPDEVCYCNYNVYTITAQQLEDQFGGVFWDEGSDDLLGLSENAGGQRYDHETYGSISIETAEHPFDLALSDLHVKGDEGDTVTVSVPVASNGPASAYSYFEDRLGSYVLYGDLPEGLELVEVGGDEWSCVDQEDFDWYLPGEDAENAEFICLFSRLSVGETIELPLTVTITDATSTTEGYVEVYAAQNLDYPGAKDGVHGNDIARIHVNAAGTGKLPSTGTSMTAVIIAAALAVALGVAVLVLARRRGMGRI